MLMYKIGSVSGEFRAEQLMNQMAHDGWWVLSVNYDAEYDLFIITFEKDA